MRKLGMLKALGTILVAIPVIAAAVLVVAHISINSIEPELPDAETVLAFARDEADLPVRLSYINTARQEMARSGVLEPSLDPDHAAPYTMAHPSFALEWADGRIFLIDLGMDRESALAFGKPAEQLLGSGPIVPLSDIASRLGPARARVAGVGFTHIHSDHTDGASVLCAADPTPIPWFSTDIQAEHSNYTTRFARASVLEAGCLTPHTLTGKMLLAVPGFPGLGVIAAGGHTPGSQIFLARVSAPAGDRLWVFTGDLVNHIDGIRLNLPKPTLYSLLVVPENRERLELVRRHLARIAARPGVELVVSHDLRHLESTGIPAWN